MTLVLFNEGLHQNVVKVPDSFNDEFGKEDVIEKPFPDFSEGVLRLLCGLVRVHANLKRKII